MCFTQWRISTWRALIIHSKIVLLWIESPPYPLPSAREQKSGCRNNNPNVVCTFAVTSRYAFVIQMENPDFIDVKVTRQKKGV